VDWEGGGWKGNSGHDVNELIAVILLEGEGCVPRVGSGKPELIIGMYKMCLIKLQTSIAEGFLDRLQQTGSVDTSFMSVT
jgi:hypothetical protein